MIKYSKYYRANDLAEAYELIQKKGNIIAGGMIWLNTCNGNYNTVVDLCDLGLDKIEEEETYFRLGAYVTLGQLETSKLLNEKYNNAFYEAVKDIVGVQLRNLATIGGSVCQKMGFSDICTLLLALNAKLEFYKAGQVTMEDFINMDRGYKDILLKVIIPKDIKSAGFYAQRNSVSDIATLNCGASINGEKLKVVVGARPGIGKTYEYSLEEIQDWKENWIAEVAKKTTVQTSLGDNIKGSKEYRKMICSEVVKRALEKLDI